MKKVLLFVLCLLLAVGCGTKEKQSSANNTNSIRDESSNSNSNSNSNSSSNQVEKKEKAHLYLFHSNTCSFCQQEKAWLESIDGKNSYLEIHYYEISQNEDLYNKVREVYGIEKTSVPLTVVGDEYFLGFSESKERKYLRTAEEMYERGVCDVVGAIIAEEDIDACMEKNKGE